MGRRCWPDGTPYYGGHWIYRGRRYALYLRDRLRCCYCYCDALVAYLDRDGFTLDHVQPLAHGGAKHDPGNLVTACMTCNRLKSDGLTSVFAPDAVRRVLNARRRLVPTNNAGIRLFKESRGALGVPRAALRRGLLDPSSVLYFNPELPLDELPDDDIPW